MFWNELKVSYLETSIKAFKFHLESWCFAIELILSRDFPVLGLFGCLWSLFLIFACSLWLSNSVNYSCFGWIEGLSTTQCSFLIFNRCHSASFVIAAFMVYTNEFFIHSAAFMGIFRCIMLINGYLGTRFAMLPTLTSISST